MALSVPRAISWLTRLQHYLLLRAGKMAWLLPNPNSQTLHEKGTSTCAMFRENSMPGNVFMLFDHQELDEGIVKDAVKLMK